MSLAEIAQLVEHNLAKVGVASSSLVFRSHTLSKRKPIQATQSLSGETDSNSIKSFGEVAELVDALL